MSLALSSAGAPVLVNKAELARRLGVSLPTMSALLLRYPDFPVHRRGTNGTAYQFDINDAIEFVQAKRDAEQASKAARDELLAQLVLPIDLVDEPPRQAISLKDQLDAAKLREIQRKEAIANGELVLAAAIEDDYATIFATWSRRLREFISQIAREQGWPEPVRADALARLADLQDRLVDDTPSMLSPREPADERQPRIV